MEASVAERGTQAGDQVLRGVSRVLSCRKLRSDLDLVNLSLET